MSSAGKPKGNAKPDECDSKEASSGGWRARSATEAQRAKLEKLMKDPSKPAFIPTPKTEKDPNKAVDFVYNVMGSSAGAGSGEFHVYRQIRRKEMLRQKVLEGRKDKDDLNKAYHQKLTENERLLQEKTEKKRKKRLKKKEAKKRRMKEGKGAKEKESSSSSEEDEDENEAESEEQKDETEKAAGSTNDVPSTT